MNDTTETAKPLKRKRTAGPARSYLDVAKDLAKQERKQSDQRAELAATDATIDMLWLELKTFTDHSGDRK